VLEIVIGRGNKENLILKKNAHRYNRYMYTICT